MQKIKKNDIVIKSPGLQIREKILNKYGDLKTFSECIGLYESSIEQYLNSKSLGSSTFKIRLTNAFAVNFKDMYLSDEDQIRKIVLMISDHIELYNQRKDMDVLEKLKDICIRRELLEDYAIVCRCYAHFFFNQGKLDRAMAYMHLAVNYLRGRENVDYFALFLSEMIVMEAGVSSKSKLNKWISECLAQFSQIEESSTIGRIFVNLGVMYKNINDFVQARYYFQKSNDYSIPKDLKAFLLRCMGEIEKLEGNYEKAYSIYLNAEQMMDKKDINRPYLYNEFALFHFFHGNMSESEYFIDKVFQNMKKQISSSDNNFLLTFTRIKKVGKKDEEIIQEIKNLLEEIQFDYIYTIHHINLIEEIIEIQKENSWFLKKLNNVLIKFYQNHELADDYKNSIKIILGRLMIEFNN